MARRFADLLKKDKMTVIGLISGTSADGVDAVLCEISGTDLDTFALRLIAERTEPYPKRLRKKILELSIAQQGTTEDVCALNFRLGRAFAEAAVNVLGAAKMKRADVDLVGSHGQTIAHLPAREMKGLDDTVHLRQASTLQLGEPAVIAEELGVPVVANFRARDMAAGGQGAPLVPLMDYLLFAHPEHARAIVNIGGISSLTYLPGGAGVSDVFAFDCGPGNMIIDALMQRMTQDRQQYDKNGERAAQGRVDGYILTQLLKHDYFKLKPPKSTGREEFGRKYAERIYEWGIRRSVRPSDILRTVTDFTTIALANAYRDFVLPLGRADEVVISGGGALNQTLMTRLRKEFDAFGNVSLLVSDEIGMPLKGKEALAFAILARETVLGRPGNIPSATGAAGPRVLGQIVPA